MKIFSAISILIGVCLLLSSIVGVHAQTAENSVAAQCLVYIGTYTGKGSKGIYLYRMDLKTGLLSPMGLAAETPNPTFLDIDAKGHFLFAADEIGNYQGKSAGAIAAYSIEPGTGKLTLLNEQSSKGSGPCHIVVDRDCKNAIAANYNGGSVAVLPINSDGTLGEASDFIQFEGHSVNASRQEKPHAHSVTLDTANRFAFVCDLGTDKVMQYRLDAEHGKLVPNAVPFAKVEAGAGPRHMAFAPNGNYAYVINEMGGSITTMAYDADHGVLRSVQTITTLPDGFSGENTCAEIAVHPSGKFLYGSNRGADSIAVYAIDPTSGTLVSIQNISCGGKTPRNFAIDPTGKFLIAANQATGNLVTFNINQGTGKLTQTGVAGGISSPVCVKFLMTPAK